MGENRWINQNDNLRKINIHMFHLTESCEREERKKRKAMF